MKKLALIILPMALLSVSIFITGAVFASPLTLHIYWDTKYPNNGQNVTLSGTVKDNQSNPLQNSEVQIFESTSNQLIASTLTDSIGYFTLSVIPGTYNIRTIPPVGSSFQDSILLNYYISGNTILNFILVPAGVVTLSGKVKDSEGNGIPNQYIQLCPTSANKANGSNWISKTTNSAGGYSFQVSPGDYWLQIIGSNNSSSVNVPYSYGIISNSGLTLNQSQNLDITLPENKVTIRVQDQYGNPVANTTIFTNCPYNYDLTLANLTATGGSYYDHVVTDVSGNVTLWLFPTTSGNNYIFTAIPPADSNVAITLLSNVSITSDKTLIITLTMPITLSGKVKDSEGNGIPNQYIQLCPTSANKANGSNWISKTTNSAGGYSFQVSPGDYWLQIIGSNNSSSVNVPYSYGIISNSGLTLNQSQNLDITLPENKVTIRVQDQYGNPVANTTIFTNCPYNYDLTLANLTATGGSYYDHVVTDVSGNVTLWLFPTTSGNNYIFTAIPPADSNVAITLLSNVSITSDKTLIITLTMPITLSGKVKDSEGNGIPNQYIQLCPTSANKANGSNWISKTTNSAGGYSFQVSPGDYWLQIIGSNNSSSVNVPYSYGIISNSGLTLNQSQNLDITLPENKVTIRVQDQYGNPVANTTIFTNCPYNYDLTLANLTATGGSYYDHVVTDVSGNVTLWLFPTTSGNNYIFTAIPPADSNFGTILTNASVTSDQTIVMVLQFIISPTYTITVSPGLHGSITPGTGKVNEGDIPTYSITPDPGYHITDVQVDSSSVGTSGNYTFPPVHTDHVISATFAINTHTITVSPGLHGSITPGTGTVNEGDIPTYSITPDPGYHITDVQVDSSSVGTSGNYTFPPVHTDHVISATFAINTHTITVSPGLHGSITPGTGTVNEGDIPTYSITPDPGYHITDVQVDSSSVGTSGNYTFPPLHTDHVISATFAINTHTITVSPGLHGSITPGTGTVNEGDIPTYSITPDPGYHITDVQVDSSSVGTSGNYTFPPVHTDHVISATFAINTHTITVSPGPYGFIIPSTGTVNDGDTPTYNITPDPGYHIADVQVDSSSVGTGKSYTFDPVHQDHTFSARFTQDEYILIINITGLGAVSKSPDQATYHWGNVVTMTPNAADGWTFHSFSGNTTDNSITMNGNKMVVALFTQDEYTLNINISGLGTVGKSPDKSTYRWGDVVTLTPLAAEGWTFDSFSGNTTTNTITMNGNKTVGTLFIQDEYIITVGTSPNGTIIPGTGTVHYGDTPNYTIAPDTGYHIADIQVDSISVGTGNSYTFTPVHQDHTISAIFAIIPTPPVPTSSNLSIVITIVGFTGVMAFFMLRKRFQQDDKP